MSPCISVLLLLFGLSAVQPAPPGKPQPKPTPPPVLEGTVKGPDGKPVERALIVVRAPSASFTDPPLIARTDASGQFRLTLASAKPHDVRVEAKGLAARRLEGVRPGVPLSIVLDKGGAIEGVVRDGASGRPVAGAKVEATAGRPLSWEPGAGVVEAVTDAKGRYRLEGLGMGLHSVSALARGYGRARKTGASVGARVDLFLFPGGSASGTVWGPDGKPVPGAVVRAESETRLWSGEVLATESDGRGRFELLGLGPGSFRLLVRHPDYSLAVVTGLAAEGTGDVEADVRLSTRTAVIGRLVGPDREPTAGRVHIEELNGTAIPISLGELLRAEAGADGRFRLEAVPAGSHVLAASAPRYGLKRVDVEVGTGAAIDVGDVSLEAGLTIRGRVRDKAGAPIAEARVTGYQPRSGAATPIDCRSEADGSFVLAGLSPGLHRVHASASGYADVGRSLDAGTEGVEFVLEPAATVTGQVVDEAGLAVTAYQLVAYPAGDATGPETQEVVHAEGRFVLSLSSGTYVIQALAPEHATGVASGVKAVAGASVDVGQIRLPRGGVLKGTVVEAGGGAVVGATITVNGPGDPGFSFPESMPQATSDAAGAFEVRGVPLGAVVASARHPDFAEGVLSGLEIDPAKGPTEARIVLTRGGRVEGFARQRDGSAIPNTLLQISRLGAETSMGMDTFPIRSDGGFAAEHVPAGRTRVVLLQVTGRRRTWIQHREVDVREGETTVVSFASRELLVRGRVTRSGIPASGMRVTLRGQGAFGFTSAGGPGAPSPPTGPQRLTGLTGDDGVFELLVDEPGTYTVFVESADRMSTFPRRTIEIPDSETATLDLDFKGTPVSGTVVEKETEQPIAQARISASATRDKAAAGRATTSGDGRFQLELEDGVYRVSAAAEGYVGSDAEVSVPGGGEVRLALARGLQIQGKVVDSRGRGVAGLYVTATASTDEPPANDGAETLADGSFQLKSLQERPYNLFVGSALAGFGWRANVAAGRSGVDLQLRPGGRVRLLVLGPEGQPAEGAWAFPTRLGGMPLESAMDGATTDAEGRVEIVLPAGAVEVRVSARKLRGTVTLNVRAGEIVAGEVRLVEAPTQP